ncbi:VOC family protein [Nocardioides bruguierae]|uniref:VOC family protein n=1 Tax=Nocardioides bruguierae TaxID=2945102 RepID=A0A9X2IFC0_9ACTN|nr:VOC family protein [Nocardioides bruguierae]MCL8025355.1 VOC family protein [Nocardioides bruguierae]MCM0621172.1 VOC family protein [Nocardioides bruguierae]
MDVLRSKTLLRPPDLRRAKHFYGEVLGLSVMREFGDPAELSTVYFLGGGALELTGPPGPPATGVTLWLQVPDVAVEHARLAVQGVTVTQEPQLMPWGLVECWITDPDGVAIALVEVPPEHPLRRDPR